MYMCAKVSNIHISLYVYVYIYIYIYIGICAIYVYTSIKIQRCKILCVWRLGGTIVGKYSLQVPGDC